VAVKDPLIVGEAGDLVEMELPPRPEVVAVARLVVGAVATAEGLFDEERAADVRLAASEACTNAIQAQMAERTGGDPEAPIVVRCSTADGHLELSVTDHGGGFDPAAVDEHPEVTDPARLEFEGGLGIPLIRILADDLEFRPIPGGTTVVMTFGPRLPSGRSLL
jgi:anti-sigma regulatory factor (Ser/Thr protein kinase)